MSDRNSLNSKNLLRTPISGLGFDQNSSSNVSRPTENSFLLRPSALTATAEKLRTDKSTPNNSVNPFSSVKESASDSGKNDESTSAENSKTAPPFDLLSKNSQHKTEKNGHESLSSEKQLRVPAVGSSSGFVFGQNISSRVVNADSSPEASKDIKEFKDVKSDDNKTESDDEKAPKSLVESAQEIQEKNAKLELEEIEPFTGEENESTIVNLNAKSFVFDKEKSNWVERGRGYVRVNDLKVDSLDTSAISKSRIIMRVQGSLKVVINSFVWPEMVIQMANDKSVRLGAQTDDGVKMFLLVFHSANDASHFFSSVSGRRQRLIESSSSSHCASAPKRSLPPSINSNDSSGVVKKARNELPTDETGENRSNSSNDSPNSENDSAVS